MATEPTLPTIPAPVDFRGRSPIAFLADFFSFAARVFNDPQVQDTGERFFAALEGAADREMPGLPAGHAPAQLPEGGIDNGS